jgi:hypothetical protein
MLSETSFGYGEFSFSWGDHICAIFESHAQQMEVMIPFIATGLRATQQCVWVSPPDAAQHFREALGAIGGDLPTLEASGQLVIISDVDYYLYHGLFEPDRTIALMRTLHEEGRRQGYQGIRATGDVSWLGKSGLDPDIWEEYELRVSHEVADRPVVVVCQYNPRQVGGEMVVKALRTHPIVILGDTVKQNPFYVVPQDGATSRRMV